MSKYHPKQYHKICVFCNDKFITTRKNQKLCEKCNKTEITLECTQCKKVFVPSKSLAYRFKLSGGKLNKHFCSTSCASLYSMNTPETVNKMLKSFRKTVKQKYGVDNVSKLDFVKKKKAKTFEKNYGKPGSKKRKELKKKEAATYKKRTGYENPSQNPKIKKKKAKTFEKNYGKPGSKKRKKLSELRANLYQQKTGYKNPSQNPEVQKKKKETTLKNYGVENPFQSKELQNKWNQKYKDQTGYDHPSKNPEVKEKRRKTCRNLYGVDSVSQVPEIHQKSVKNGGGLGWDVYIKYNNNKTTLLRSFWEVIMFIYFIKKGIKFNYEAIHIEWRSSDEKKHIYTPDFLINNNHIVEVKGWIRNEDIQKRKQNACKKAGYTYELVTNIKKYKEFLENNNVDINGIRNSIKEQREQNKKIDKKVIPLINLEQYL